MRAPVIMMFIAAAAISINADARGRGGSGKSYRSSSSSSYGSYKPSSRRSYTPSQTPNYTSNYAPSSGETASSSAPIATAATAATAAAVVGTAAVMSDKPEAPAATLDHYVQYDMEYSMDQPARSANTVREMALGEKVRVYEQSREWSRISPPGKPEEWLLTGSLGTQKVGATHEARSSKNPPASSSTTFYTYQAGSYGANVTALPFRSMQVIRRLTPNEHVIAYEEMGDWARISPHSATTEEWVSKSDLVQMP